MKKITVRFEADPTLDGIEVVVRAPEQDGEARALMERLSAQPPETIWAFDGEGNFCALPYGELVLASVDGKLVRLVTEKGSRFTRRTLQSLEEELDPRRFLRISRYEIVNLEKIQRCDFTLAGTLRLELQGGCEAWASRRCIPTIRKRLMGKRDAL